jgi:hypothetical protein
MSAVTSIPAGGGPAVGEEPADGKKRDLWVTYWIFAGFYTVMAAGTVLLGRVTPPPRPDVTDLQVAHWFAQHHLTIQAGFTVLLMVTGGAAISNGIIGYFMQRMSSGRVLSYAFIGSMGVGAVPGFTLMLACWLTATFRPGRSPQVLHLLYDLGMLSYNGSLGCFTAAYLVLAIAILYDQNRILPKWYAYVTVWQVVTEVLATQMWLFRSGALAWNGMITFYIAVVMFGIWVVLLFPLFNQAIKKEPADAPPLYGAEDSR